MPDNGRLRFESGSGEYFEMEVIGYEYPDVDENSAARDLDLNWLVFRIHAGSALGEWTADFPAGTTEELVGFAGWLEERSEGQSCYGLFGFIEPVLLFEARRCSGRRIRMLVSIDHELRPEWDPQTERSEKSPIVLDLILEHAAIAQAARAVREMTLRFPVRPWNWRATRTGGVR